MSQRPKKGKKKGAIQPAKITDTQPTANPTNLQKEKSKAKRARAKSKFEKAGKDSQEVYNKGGKGNGVGRR